MASNFDAAFLTDEMGVRRAANCLLKHGLGYGIVPVEEYNVAGGWKIVTSAAGIACLAENGIIVITEGDNSAN